MTTAMILLALLPSGAMLFCAGFLCRRLATWQHWSFVRWFLAGIAGCWSLLAWRFLHGHFGVMDSTPESGFAAIEFLYTALPVWIACYAPGASFLLAVLWNWRCREGSAQGGGLASAAATPLLLILLFPFFGLVGLELSRSTVKQRVEESIDKQVLSNAYVSLKDGKKYFVRYEAISGMRLVPLEEMLDLEVLHLDGTELVDADLVHIRHHKKIFDLSMTDTAISDRGLSHLKRLHSMRTLNLANTQVSDAGLRYLSDMSDLRELSLRGTTIGNDGLNNLAPLGKSLWRLNLEDTAVTDEGLRSLIEFENLTSLRLSGCQLSIEAISTLKLAIPKCKILFPGFDNRDDRFKSPDT